MILKTVYSRDSFRITKNFAFLPWYMFNGELIWLKKYYHVQYHVHFWGDWYSRFRTTSIKEAYECLKIETISDDRYFEEIVKFKAKMRSEEHQKLSKSKGFDHL